MESIWTDAGDLLNTSLLVNYPNGTQPPPMAQPEPPPTHQLYLRIWVGLVSGIVFITGFGGNALVPVLIWKNKELRHSTNVFLLNLAVADLLVLLICLPTALVELYVPIIGSWVLGPFLCRLVPFMEISVTRASVLTLTIISVERYVAIGRPLRSSSICTRQIAVGICLGIWPVSFLAAGPYWTATIYSENQGVHNITTCLMLFEQDYIKNYILISCGIFYFLPLCFLVALYFCIGRRLLDRTSWSRRGIDSAQWKGRKQVAIMLGIVVGVFFLCLLPFQSIVIWMVVASSKAYNAVNEDMFYNGLYFARLMIYVNSAVNPIIYNTMSAKFRSALIKLFTNVQKPGSRLLRRRSTLTTSLSSSSGPSKPISLGRRASLAIGRRFSNASSRRSSEKSLAGRRSSGASSSSRKTSNSSSRKSSSSSHKPHVGGEQDATTGQLSPDNENGAYLSSYKLEREPEALFLLPLCESDKGVPSEVYNRAITQGADGKESWFAENALFSGPAISTNSGKKVSFDEFEIKRNHDYHEEEEATIPVAPPRIKRNNKRTLTQDVRASEGTSYTLNDDNPEFREEVLGGGISSAVLECGQKDYRYDRFQRDCKCNSRTITRCSFRKPSKMEIV